MPNKHFHIGTFLAASLFVLFSIVAIFFSHKPYYPFLSIEVPAEAGGKTSLTLTMLMEGQTSAIRCERTANNLASSIHSVCMQCRISTRQCLAGLTLEQQGLLSAAPLQHYSARLPTGVTLYEADDIMLAKRTCEESERQSLTTGTPVKCHAPGTQRPIIVSTTATEKLWRDISGNHQLIWIALALAALVALFVQLIRPLIPDLGHQALALPRRSKQMILLLADIVSIEFTLWAAIVIRLETADVSGAALLPLSILAPVIALPIFVRLGLYRAVVRYWGLHALLVIVKAVAIYTALLAASIYLLSIPEMPRSVALIHGALAMLLIGGSRALARHWLSSAQNAKQTDHRKRVLVYGAGSAGVQLASALQHSRELMPVAFIDDDPALQKKEINGLDVHAPADLPLLVTRFDIAEVLLAVPSAPRSRRSQILAELESLPVQIRTLPGLAELAQGKVKVNNLREVEIEDLLGRDPVPPNSELLGTNITDKAVMVTGAGGSIGSELCRQILDQKPSALVLYENSEFALYAIEQELLNRQSRIPIFPILGSVIDQPRMEQVMRRFKVQTLFHAAAYKHVPMVEMNPIQGVINNIFGTWHTAQAALNTGIGTFVLISTDKAVRPTNTMGTTKRFAEMILQALHEQYPDRTRFTMVRFGNVLGSSGSVVPLFRGQIKRGGPVTVTDPRIIRYFMTIPEAAQLVIQAGAMGQGSDVFVLDMGEPVKILDLAKRMIHLSGLTEKTEEHPNGDIEIVFSGLRPGEKLYEELLIGDNVTKTNHPRIQRANEKTPSFQQISSLLAELETTCEINDSEGLRILLQRGCREFKPQCENKDLLKVDIVATQLPVA